MLLNQNITTGSKFSSSQYTKEQYAFNCQCTCICELMPVLVLYLNQPVVFYIVCVWCVEVVL